MTLDNFDRAILWELQQNNRQSNARIGDAVGLSEPAVRRRVRQLREAGLILADVSLVKVDRLGITVAVLVRFEKESQQTYDAFKTQMSQTPQIAQCYTVTGDEDFLLIGHFPDMVAYDDWVNSELLTNPDISRSTTHVVYRRTKFQTAIPL
eukprot:Skav212954  [mRNA]  locus=scaffold7842:397:849:- [translate_table: standard]